jgi:hypothetical protein
MSLGPIAQYRFDSPNKASTQNGTFLTCSGADFLALGAIRARREARPSTVLYYSYFHPRAHRVALIPNEASPSDVGQGSLNGDAPRRIEPARWVGNWRTASVRWVRYYPKA